MRLAAPRGVSHQVVRLGLGQLVAEALERLVHPRAGRGQAQLGQRAELAADVLRAGVGEAGVRDCEVLGEPLGRRAAVPAGEGPWRREGAGASKQYISGPAGSE